MTTDSTALRAKITRLRRTLTILVAQYADLRAQYANLLAAVRAAVAAHEEGEADPMTYLYDELPDHASHSAVNSHHHDGAGTAWNGK
ncbi:MAG: hypothetical protein ACRDRQ_21320 [Pseudonocardiaceae bacterium]